jgi:hypothetical protein|nr:hypothetical protein [Kofleriaceae bacterium]
MCAKPIFDDDDDDAALPSAIWEPPANPDGPRAIELPPLASALEAALLAILQRPVDHELGYRDDFDRRERELRAMFARLTRIEVRQLQQCVDVRCPASPLAVAFSRLISERRRRLLEQLEAVACSRP